MYTRMYIIHLYEHTRVLTYTHTRISISEYINGHIYYRYYSVHIYIYPIYT